MALVFNVNEVLTIKDLLAEYQNESISNFIEKLSYSINSPITGKDTLLNTYSELLLPALMSSDNILTDLLENINVLQFVPIKIKVNIVNNEAMLFINGNVYVISKTDYDLILTKKDSYSIPIDRSNTNSLLADTKDNCINSECYYLHTRLYRLYKLPVNIIDILTLGLDYTQRLLFIHTEIPLINLNDFLNNITGKESYLVNKHTRTDTWVTKNLFDDLFNKNMSAIKNNRIREFVWYVRSYCEGKDTTRDYVLKDCFSMVNNKLSTAWSNISTAELAEDFPELSNISDFTNIELVKVTVIGLKRSLNINTNTSSVLLNNQLEKLKNDLLTIDS